MTGGARGCAVVVLAALAAPGCRAARETRAAGAARYPSPAAAVPRAPATRPHGPRIPRVAARAAEPPRVVDRGDDVVAVARSLLEYGRWLVRDEPDPARVGRAYAAGSPIGRGVAALVVRLRRDGRRIREVDTAPLELVPLPSPPDVRAFRLTEHLAHRELVDRRGHVLGRAGPAVEHYLVSILRAGPGAPWRLNVVERAGAPVEVHL